MIRTFEGWWERRRVELFTKNKKSSKTLPAFESGNTA